MNEGEFLMKFIIYSAFVLNIISCAMTHRIDDSRIISQWDIEFDKGENLIKNNNCEDGLPYLQNVVTYSASNHTRLKAHALNLISQCYMLNGDFRKSIAAAMDSLKLNQLLSEEISLVEIPARLSLSYLFLKQDSESQYYFKITEQGISKIRQKQLFNKNNFKYNISQLLYKIGQLPENNQLDLSQKLVLASQQHLFLIEAMETNDPIWSVKAYDELVQQTNSIWNQALLSENSDEAQNIFKLLNHFSFIKSNRKPAALTQNLNLNNFFQFVENKEIELTKIAQEKSEKTPLTQEAIARDQIEIKYDLKDVERSPASDIHDEPK